MPRTPSPPPVERLRSRLAAARHGGPTGSTENTDDGGFVVIEVLVGMIVFAIVAASATVAIIGGIHANAATQTRVAATNIAQQAVATAQALPRASLISRTYASAGYTVQRTVIFPTIGGVTGCPAGGSSTVNTISIVVKVTGTPLAGRTIAMDTVLAC